MSADEIAAFLAGHVEELTEDWQDCSIGLPSAPEFDFWNFRHVIKEEGWRLRRAGLDPHDPLAMPTIEADLSNAMACYQKQGRIPPLYLYADPRQKAFQVQLALPVRDWQAFVPTLWDGSYLIPLTILARHVFEGNRRQVSTVLAQMPMPTEQAESARTELLDALSVGEEGQAVSS